MVTYIIASKANQPYLAEVRRWVWFLLVPNARRVPRKELSWRVSQSDHKTLIRVEWVPWLGKLFPRNCSRSVVPMASIQGPVLWFTRSKAPWLAMAPHSLSMCATTTKNCWEWQKRTKRNVPLRTLIWFKRKWGRKQTAIPSVRKFKSILKKLNRRTRSAWSTTHSFRRRLRRVWYGMWEEEIS